jgi:hypothetical protein
MQVIKWFEEPYFEQSVVLGNVPFTLIHNWNIRDETWSLSIITNDNIPLVVGKKLNINTDMLSSVFNELKPKGALVVVSVAKNIDIITRDNMGTEIDLVFVGDDELL